MKRVINFFRKLFQPSQSQALTKLFPITEEDIQTYSVLLLEVLQATVESNGDAQVVYTLLAANTDKLNSTFEQILRFWITQTLSKVEPDEAESMAAYICNFSNFIQQFPLGNRANNLEIAIAGYEITQTIYTHSAFPENWAAIQHNLGNAYSNRILGERAENLELAIAACNASLEVRTRSAFPQDWAMTQNNLGEAYRQRILGERADNLELAIAAYNAALEVRTRSAFPQDWAMTQNNLGNAYRERILGERTENLELAIAACNASLEVRTRSAFPQKWAMTQNNLGVAYGDRILGERAENLELAIAAYNESLEVYTRSAFPQNWAMTQNNLGEAYRQRMLGERADNLELAIAAYNAALEVRTRSAFPQDWARMQNNLGNAYRERILGERADNLELAIAACNASLEVYTRSAFPQDWAATQNHLGNVYSERILGERAQNLENAIAAYSVALEVRTCTAFPEQWATTQNNLGEAYRQRILGERAENLENAIAAYSAALEVYTPTAFPQNWAGTQNNLGEAYRQRILGERAENLELAICACKAALEVRTRSAFPQDWAMTQNNLGNAYRERILRERTENVELAIAAYNAALEVYTRSAFPLDNAETLKNFGLLYQEEKQWELAENTFTEAIITVEGLRGEINSGEEAKRKQAEKWNPLYHCMAEVSLTLGKTTQAIEYIERSKTRNLVEQILQGDLTTIFPQEVVTELEQLNNKIVSSQYELQNSKAANPTALAQDIQTWRQQRQDLQDRYLPVGSSFQFEQFQKTLDSKTAIIEWYITADNILAFIIKPNGQKLTYWQSQPEDLDALFGWVNAYIKDYENPEDSNKIQWQNQLETRLKKLAEILHLGEIITQLPPECQRLILVPHHFLHLFPLHALPVNNSYLMNLFPQGVSYVPSCQILQQVQLRQRPDFKSLFAIQNPTEDLVYTDLEVGSILNIFPFHQVLSYKQATKDALIQEIPALKDANYLHFSCHGSFNLDSPQDSCLMLAESIDENKNLDLNKCLTLGNLFERDFRLDKCRLVVLSACETGLVDVKNTSDEYISLPSGFLYVGSIGVVSSLWTVDDLSTAFLMIKFSQNLQAAMLENGDFSVAVELQKAQNWLRNATIAELQTWASKLQLSPKTNEQLEKFLYYCKHYCEPEEKQFQDPYHWAGFCAIGL